MKNCEKCPYLTNCGAVYYCRFPASAKCPGDDGRGGGFNIPRQTRKIRANLNEIVPGVPMPPMYINDAKRGFNYNYHHTRIFTMYYVDGLTLAKIAREIGCTKKGLYRYVDLCRDVENGGGPK